MDVKSEINQLIAQNPVLMIEKPACPSCKKAKALLKSLLGESNPKFKIIDLTSAEYAAKMAPIQDYMNELTKARTVPRIFIGGKFVGGGDETVAIHAKGELEGKLKAAGAL